MARYITNIHVNKLFHLSDFDIPVADDNAPHLILTGKNGSGKTITLNAIADLLDKIKEDADLIYQDYPKWMRTLNDVNIEFSNGYSFIREYQEGNFIIVFYRLPVNLKF